MTTANRVEAFAPQPVAAGLASQSNRPVRESISAMLNVLLPAESLIVGAIALLAPSIPKSNHAHGRDNLARAGHTMLVGSHHRWEMAVELLEQPRDFDVGAAREVEEFISDAMEALQDAKTVLQSDPHYGQGGSHEAKIHAVNLISSTLKAMDQAHRLARRAASKANPATPRAAGRGAAGDPFPAHAKRRSPRQGKSA